MDLKAYLKGAGIGIIVTAVILMIVGACNNNNKISDEEVIKRAKELGYVESSTLTSPSSLNGQDKDTQVADNKDTDVKEPETKDPDVTEPEKQEPVTGELDVQEPDKQEPNSQEPDKQEPDNQEPEKQEPDKEEPKVSDTEEYVVITISPGQGSEEAARACKDAGLVEDSVAFNSYMCANGYDRRLNVGNHEIHKGADNETICKKLCGME